MNSQETLEMLERRITRWKWCIASLALILVIGYLFYFAYHLEQNPAKDAEKWGQFGDFFGGILNPLVAFAAFYWLTQSVKIQKNELEETRKALLDSAKAQKDQVVNGDRNIKISALTTIVNAGNSQINTIDYQLKLYEDKIISLNRYINDLERKKSAYSGVLSKSELNIKNEYLKSISIKEKEVKEFEGNISVLYEKRRIFTEECASCLHQLREILNESVNK